MKQSVVRQEIGLQIHGGHTSMPSPSSAPIYHISASKPHQYHAPSPQSQVFDCVVDMQDGFDKLVTSNSGNPSAASFTPVSEATEGTRFQFPIQEQGEGNMMYEAPLAIEADEGNLWWDQSFQEFETDPFGFLQGENPWSEGCNYFVYG